MMELETLVDEWETIERPGYFGAKRDERFKQYDSFYGKGNWRIVWKIGDALVDKHGVYALYEDAYFEFLNKNRDVLDLLVSSASDVYDDEPSNIRSGLNYDAQETNRTHVQDIAIRRALVRMGKRFEGKELIRIRDKLGDHALSKTLSPGHVPFHRPEFIEKPELQGWWDASSVESFYQSNKYLQIKKS